MKKAESRMRAKIKNIVDDLHWKSIDFLCKNFEVVVIPKFGVKSMVSRNRFLPKKTKRAMLSLRHFVFRQRLIHRSRFHGDVRVVVCGEAYTSQTCGSCGLRNKKLGSSRVFVCRECNFRCDRDFNGSRNILLKNIL